MDLDSLHPTISKYSPHNPFAKQLAFLMAPNEEVLFGGALGGGKSDALLMAALQYVHIPNFSAIVFRMTLTDHQLEGGPLFRMMSWLNEGGFLQSKEVKFNGKHNRFEFKTYDLDTGRQNGTSTISFGYIGKGNAKQRYQGTEYNLIEFDEVTQHKKIDYEYMFTRIRKCVCPKHTERDSDGYPLYQPGCKGCEIAKTVPTKMMATCNPDGPGFGWVKNRWAIKPDKTQEEEERTGIKAKWRGTHPDRLFIPANFRDNPHINHAEYGRRLKTQISDEALYDALVNGSWGVAQSAKFKRRWKRQYCRHEKFIKLAPDFSANGRILDSQDCFAEIFLTVDTATTAEEAPGSVELFPTKVSKECFTVISAWGFTTCGNLLWLGMFRDRIEIPEVIQAVKETYDIWGPKTVVIEENGVGKGVVQYCERMGMHVTPVTTTKDKVENATNAIFHMSKGRIWLPSTNEKWVEEIEDELFIWQGHPDESDDIVDTLTNAANHVDWTNAASPDDYFHHHIVDSNEVILPQAVFQKHRFN